MNDNTAYVDFIEAIVMLVLQYTDHITLDPTTGIVNIYIKESEGIRFQEWCKVGLKPLNGKDGLRKNYVHISEYKANNTSNFDMPFSGEKENHYDTNIER